MCSKMCSSSSSNACNAVQNCAINSTSSECCKGRDLVQLAERKGFEPSIPVKVYALSRGAPSTTRPPLQRGKEGSIESHSPPQVPQADEIRDPLQPDTDVKSLSGTRALPSGRLPISICQLLHNSFPSPHTGPKPRLPCLRRAGAWASTGRRSRPPSFPRAPDGPQSLQRLCARSSLCPPAPPHTCSRFFPSSRCQLP